MKKLLSCLLAVVLSLCVFSAIGCDKKTDAGTDTATEKAIMLRDFEVYNPDFMSLQMSLNFGAIDVNTDERFVSSGKQSAKLRPYGGYNWGETPTVKIPFYSTVLNYNYKDLTKFASVTMKFYNDETYDVNLYYNFDFNDGRTSPQKRFVLKNGWNEVEMKIDHDVLSMFYDLGECKDIMLAFDNYAVENLEFADAPTIYLDEVKLNFLLTEYVPAEIDFILDEYEVCSFEKAYQQYVMKSSSNSGRVADLSVVSTDNGVLPTQGNKMLKAVFTNGNGGYSRLSFTPKLFETVDFSRFADNPDDYVFAVDGYNATSRVETIEMNYIWGGIKEWYDSRLSWGVNMQAVTWTLPTNAWSTYKLPLSTVASWNTNPLKGGFYLTMIYINNGIENGGTFYFDNFRIEKI